MSGYGACLSVACLIVRVHALRNDLQLLIRIFFPLEPDCQLCSLGEEIDERDVDLFRYFLRVTVVKRLSDLVREQDIIVHTLSQYPELNNSIKMEVGIEDCLHIEFEYNKSK